MNKINDGGPAFPQTIDDCATMRSVTQGMSLRYYLAGQALIGILSSQKLDFQNIVKREANIEEAYHYADDMLKNGEVKQ